MQLVGACPCVPGLPPTAPAQGKQPLSQDLQEAQSALTWKPSEQLAGRRASSREEEAAQPRLAQALLGWSRVRLQDGRAPALLRGPIWQSCWREAALPWVSLATTCLAARFPALDLAGFARLGNATGAFLASAPLLPCLYTKAPGVLTEGLGAGGLHTVKGNDSESSVRGKGRASAGLLHRLLGRPD